MAPRKLPIGIQDFENIRTDGYVYVDKTAYIYRLAGEGKVYFLGRPRRFGKSLLVSTFKAYFQGKKELFEGREGQVKLAITELEQDWIEYPVFHIDLSVEYYRDLKSLEAGLGTNLWPLEQIWGKNPPGEADTPAARFMGLIRRAAERSGKRVVVLIDEYDKPLLGTMDDLRPHEEIRKGLKAFYGVLKAADPWLRFVFITGVTKFSQGSIFSDLNQLEDISMNEDYAGICGISASELTANFPEELQALARENEMSYEEALAEMHKRYNGYHFSPRGEGMFNPFSVLNTLGNRNFDYYWFETGTPAFLVEALKNIDFDLPSLSEGFKVAKDSLTNYRADGGNPTPVLYQSGYLTIKGYEKETGLYTLGYPNGEVEYGFLRELLPAYTPWIRDRQGFYAGNFIEDLFRNDVDAFMNRLRAFFSSVPYQLNDKTERYYQTVCYLVFRLLGQFAQVEVASARGRADMVIGTARQLYVFEFKLSGAGSAEEALKQIDDRGYLLPYTAGNRQLVKIGAVFDKKTRTLGDWKHTP